MITDEKLKAILDRLAGEFGEATLVTIDDVSTITVHGRDGGVAATSVLFKVIFHSAGNGCWHDPSVFSYIQLVVDRLVAQTIGGEEHTAT